MRRTNGAGVGDARYDDDVLPSGAALYAELAVRRLNRLAALV